MADLLRDFDWRLDPAARDEYGVPRVRVCSALDPSRSLEEQELWLDENLAQVSYARNIVVDVGWLPAMQMSGAFHVFLVVARDRTEPGAPIVDRPIDPDDWESPDLKLRTRSLDELPSLMAQARDRALELVASGEATR